MMSDFDFIPVNEPLLNGNEKKYLIECIDSGWISSEGSFVQKFQSNYAKKVGRAHAVAVSNGSVALDIAVAALGISEGDEVIMPAFTIISCAAAIIRSGATPVLVDCDPEHWNMNENEIERRITPNTKAIMIVHIFGLPVDMAPILKIAKEHDLKIIEDAAEMHGQQYHGRYCGSFGDISTFSFYPNKHITTGEGGMIMTDDPLLAEKCESLRNLCFTSKKRFYHEELGWNSRMSNLQAAVGVAQLERLDEFVEIKRRMGAKYTQLINCEEEIQLPIASTSYADNIYWVYGMVLRKECTMQLEDVVKKLSEYGIGTRPFFWPMHEQPVFKRMGLFNGEEYPVSEYIARNGFYVPSGLALTDKQILRVSSVLNDIFTKK